MDCLLGVASFSPLKKMEQPQACLRVPSVSLWSPSPLLEKGVSFKLQVLPIRAGCATFKNANSSQIFFFILSTHSLHLYKAPDIF